VDLKAINNGWMGVKVAVGSHKKDVYLAIDSQESVITLALDTCKVCKEKKVATFDFKKSSTCTFEAGSVEAEPKVLDVLLPYGQEELTGYSMSDTFCFNSEYCEKLNFFGYDDASEASSYISGTLGLAMSYRGQGLMNQLKNYFRKDEVVFSFKLEFDGETNTGSEAIFGDIDYLFVRKQEGLGDKDGIVWHDVNKRGGESQWGVGIDLFKFGETET
jgi:hypothetical protein